MKLFMEEHSDQRIQTFIQLHFQLTFTVNSYLLGTFKKYHVKMLVIKI
jgi:hypothetical protein